MTLASIEGTIVAALIAFVMVVIRWLSERNAKQQAEQDSLKREDARRDAPTAPDSEEERMRRFMEALGIPSEGAPAPPSPPPMRQAPPRPAPTVRPVPPIISREATPRRTAPTMPPPVPRQVRPQTPLPVPARPPYYEPPAAESAPAPTTPAGQIHLPELETTVVEEFHTTSSIVTAGRSEQAPVEGIVLSPIHEVGGVAVGRRELWREALRSPEAMKSAFVLREILGPPRGLQTVGATHSFPSL
jgi:hypothetical protein